MQTMRGDRISLRLELDQGLEPISGRLVAADGDGEEFVGWLGLGTALEKLTGNGNSARIEGTENDGVDAPGN